ncbi:MAG: hypothetical protein E6Q89_02535 [Bacteroidia bacterium]|nr:MAG: hypothetical protein E6Q89_02535 [Bacteroidia bacterium]
MPFVSIRSLLLTNKETPLHTSKKKNKGTGVPKATLKIGNVIITIDAVAQFDIVEKGIISGSTI